MSDKSDWDASDNEASTSKAPAVVVAAPRKKFADEDLSDSDDIKDDWDASDDEDDEANKKAKPAGPAPPVRQKGITKQKIAEKEAAEKARLEEMAARRNQDPNERRLQERAAQIKADMDNAAALFGSAAITGGDDPFSMPLRTAADAEALATKLSDIITGRYADLPIYSVFLKSFVRQLNLPLVDIQVREVASGLTALANEKQKAQKEAAGGKKKSKAATKPVLGASKGLAAGRVDTRSYEDALDDSGEFDDFQKWESLIKFLGVVTGKNLIKLMDYAKANHFAIPAINVTSSSTAVAALEGARESKAPIILQVSQGGAAFWAGKGVANDKQQASIAGAVAAAHYVRAIAPTYGIPVVMHSDHCAKKLLPWFDGMLEADEAYYKQHGEPLFSSHMLDLSEETKEENIAICEKYFKRMAKVDLWLEMEIGITGGEEDGVNNEDVDNNSLYTQPEDILDIVNALSPISPMYSIAAGFGNVHGVYKPGNVKLRPELLEKHQKHVHESLKTKDSLPVFLVFHGGSGSSKEEISTAVKNGVVKMNVDTDTQWAYMLGFRDYFKKKADYVATQVGNPEGEDKPNKKYYDPRVWVREGEKTMVERVKEACKDLLNENRI